MPVELSKSRQPGSLPVWFVPAGGIDQAGLHKDAVSWAGANGFTGQSGRVLILPGAGGGVSGALLGIGSETTGFSPLVSGRLAGALPAGDWHFENEPASADLSALGLRLGGYVFTRYGKEAGRELRFAVADGGDLAAIERWAEGSCLARDLVNTPANDMGPDALEATAAEIAKKHGARIKVTTGEKLLAGNFPMIHAVGRAGAQAPRLIDMTWGDPAAPKVTLVGKGVCFDTGGLDIKLAASMRNMKKDMGGAANVLGLATMIMAAGLKLRLRVLIPAVENSIAGNAFRPGDILISRKGLGVEIGNTDAEGRLVLADALTLADEEAPELVIDMATLTGAARVALGPDLPPFYTDDEILAADLSNASQTVADPIWRMPLWAPYAKGLSSNVTDLGNITSNGFAGSVTAALFLQKFVEKAASWAHFDIFAWNPADRPHGPAGGEAQAIRAIEQVLVDRYGS